MLTYNYTKEARCFFKQKREQKELLWQRKLRQRERKSFLNALNAKIEIIILLRIRLMIQIEWNSKNIVQHAERLPLIKKLDRRIYV